MDYNVCCDNYQNSGYARFFIIFATILQVNAAFSHLPRSIMAYILLHRWRIYAIQTSFKPHYLPILARVSDGVSP